ncbi:MAG: amidohydrolase [Clostridiales bacterium]|jgi:5-methylthioadenosine/S-adenosylhomocysteine deaminase|nr:amidohydrolase [Clostridiales bacterium]
MSKLLFDRPYVYGYGEKYVAVEDDLITYIGSERPDKPFDRVISGKNCLMLPGLYNLHTHAAMTLFRGYGEELPLSRWLNERIFPAEELLTPERVYAASRFACAEMIKNGIVSFSDMYFFCEETAKAVLESGMKANISRSVVSFDPDADPSKDDRLKEALKLYDEYNGKGSGRLRVDLSLHAEYTNTERMCRYLAGEAKNRDAVMQIHLSETEDEHQACIERHNMTPAEFMQFCGVFESPTVAAHCVFVSDGDIEILKNTGVTVAHNPVSNLKLGSGIAPLNKFLKFGVNVALGTDGAASNNTLDIMKEMYVAAILHKGAERRADIISAESVIKMATENGASAQRRDGCGVISEGNKADLILIDTDTVNNIPSFDPAYTAVYSANSSDVRLTVCDGEILYENGEFTKIDIERIKADMKKISENYFK